MQGKSQLLIATIAIFLASCAPKVYQEGSQDVSNPVISSQSHSLTFDATKVLSQNAAEIFNLGTVSPGGTNPTTITLLNTTGTTATGTSSPTTSGTISLSFVDLFAQLADNLRYTVNMATSSPCVAAGATTATLKINKSCKFDITLNYVMNEDYQQQLTTRIVTGLSASGVPAGSLNPEFGKIIFVGEKAQEIIQPVVPLFALLKMDKLTDSVVIPANGSIVKRYYMGNAGSGLLTIPTVVPPANSSITLNSCTSLTTLKPNGTCFFEITFNYNSAADKANYVDYITFSSNAGVDTSNAKVVLSITNQPVVVPVVSVAFNQVGIISEAALTDPNAKTRIYVANTGSGIQNLSTLAIPSPYIVIGTSCTSALKVGKTCFYDLGLDTTKVTNATGVSLPLSFGSSSTNIAAGSPVVPGVITCKSGFDLVNGSCVAAQPVVTDCTVADAQSNGVAILHSDSTITGQVTNGVKTSCLLADTACSTGYAISLNHKSCDPIITQCTVSDATANGVIFLNSDSIITGQVIAGDISACKLASCRQYYSLDGSAKSCVAITAQCSQSDALANNVILTHSNSTIVGQVIAGDKSACLLASNSCDLNYTIAANSKSCSPVITNCSISDAQSNGVLTAHSTSTIVGQVIAGNKNACLLASNSCDLNYTIAGDQKSCTPVVSTCSVADATSNGVITTHSNSTIIGSVIAGDKSACLLASNSCAPNYAIAGDQKSCTPVVSTCSVADATSNGVSVLYSNSTIVGQVIAGDKSACLLASSSCDQNYTISSDKKSCSQIITNCSVADATANGVIVNNSDSTVVGQVIAGDKSACLLASSSCNPNYTISANSKSCMPVVGSCSQSDAIANGVITDHSNSTIIGNVVAGDKSACLLASNSCNSNYAIAGDQKSCIPVVSACTIADATANGVIVINSDSTIIGNVIAGDKSACLLASSSCNPNYAIASDSKSCSAVVSQCSVADAQSNGIIIDHSNSLVTGQVIAGNKSACLLASNSCDANYALSSDSKSCSAVVFACNATDAQSNNVNLTNSNAAVVGNVIAGDSSACLLASNACNPYFELAADHKSCSALTAKLTIARQDAHCNINVSSDLINFGMVGSELSTFETIQQGKQVIATATCDANYTISLQEVQSDLQTQSSNIQCTDTSVAGNKQCTISAIGSDLNLKVSGVYVPSTFKLNLSKNVAQYSVITVADLLTPNSILYSCDSASASCSFSGLEENKNYIVKSITNSDVATTAIGGVACSNQDDCSVTVVMTAEQSLSVDLVKKAPIIHMASRLVPRNDHNGYVGPYVNQNVNPIDLRIIYQRANFYTLHQTADCSDVQLKQPLVADEIKNVLVNIDNPNDLSMGFRYIQPTLISDSLNNISYKLYNDNVESSCVALSVTSDTIAPVISFTTISNNVNDGQSFPPKLDGQLAFSVASFTDTNIDKVTYSIDTNAIDQIAMNPGDVSTTFDHNLLTVGSNGILYSACDLAGNCTTGSVGTFVYSEPSAVTPTLRFLQIAKSGDGDGTITDGSNGIGCAINSRSCSYVLAPGINVALTATPDADSIFIGYEATLDANLASIMDCSNSGSLAEVCQMVIGSGMNYATAKFGSKPWIFSKNASDYLSYGGENVYPLGNDFLITNGMNILKFDSAGMKNTAFNVYGKILSVINPNLILVTDGTQVQTYDGNGNIVQIFGIDLRPDRAVKLQDNSFVMCGRVDGSSIYSCKHFSSIAGNLGFLGEFTGIKNNRIADADIASVQDIQTVDIIADGTSAFVSVKDKTIVSSYDAQTGFSYDEFGNQIPTYSTIYTYGGKTSVYKLNTATNTVDDAFIPAQFSMQSAKLAGDATINEVLGTDVRLFNDASGVIAYILPQLTGKVSYTTDWTGMSQASYSQVSLSLTDLSNNLGVTFSPSVILDKTSGQFVANYKQVDGQVSFISDLQRASNGEVLSVVNTSSYFDGTYVADPYNMSYPDGTTVYNYFYGMTQSINNDISNLINLGSNNVSCEGIDLMSLSCTGAVPASSSSSLMQEYPSFKIAVLWDGTIVTNTGKIYKNRSATSAGTLALSEKSGFSAPISRLMSYYDGLASDGTTVKERVKLFFDPISLGNSGGSYLSGGVKSNFYLSYTRNRLINLDGATGQYNVGENVLADGQEDHNLQFTLYDPDTYGGSIDTMPTDSNTIKPVVSTSGNMYFFNNANFVRRRNIAAPIDVSGYSIKLYKLAAGGSYDFPFTRNLNDIVECGQLSATDGQFQAGLVSIADQSNPVSGNVVYFAGKITCRNKGDESSTRYGVIKIKNNQIDTTFNAGITLSDISSYSGSYFGIKGLEIFGDKLLMNVETKTSGIKINGQNVYNPIIGFNTDGSLMSTQPVSFINANVYYMKSFNGYLYVFGKSLDMPAPSQYGTYPNYNNKAIIRYDSSFNYDSSWGMTDQVYKTSGSGSSIGMLDDGYVKTDSDQKIIFIKKAGEPDRLLIMEPKITSSASSIIGAVLINIDTGLIDSAKMTSLFGLGSPDGSNLQGSYNEYLNKLYIYGSFNMFNGKIRNGLVKLDY